MTAETIVTPSAARRARILGGFDASLLVLSAAAVLLVLLIGLPVG